MTTLRSIIFLLVSIPITAVFGILVPLGRVFGVRGPFWFACKYTQVMLSARELNTESMPNRSWVNERLTFTHGYGVAMTQVSKAIQPMAKPGRFKQPSAVHPSSL